MSFDLFGLDAEILRAVREQGYDTPTPIQAQAIPAVMEGKDLMAGAQTGTGKTAGFTLPLLHRLVNNSPAAGRSRKAVRALVVTPTRELAAQVHDSVRTYGQHLNLRSTVVFGGVSIRPQMNKLSAGTDVLVATPGRLLDHAGQGTVDLSQVEVLILDEADRMLDMGFIHDIRRIIKLCPRKENRQTLLFSATFSREIKALAAGLMTNPELIEVAGTNRTADRVAQRVYKVDKARKRELLSFLIGDGNWQQVLVFNRTKHGANRLAKQLESDGLSATAIHGNKSQGARTKALKAFKDGNVRVLVATDIAARGLDIDQLPHVVNFDLPNVPEDYVHRIGRTGRAGNEGEAISLVSADESKLLRDIEKLIHAQLPSEILPGYEPTKAGERQAAEAAKKAQSNRRQRPGKAARPGRNARRNGKPGGGRSQAPKPSANNGNRRRSSRSRTQSSNLADRILGPDS